VTKLVGVYSDRNVIIEYEDGNKWQSVSLNFEAKVISGELQVTDEATEVEFVSIRSLEDVDVMENQREFIHDALADLQEALIE